MYRTHLNLFGDAFAFAFAFIRPSPSFALPPPPSRIDGDIVEDTPCADVFFGDFRIPFDVADVSRF